MGGTSAHKNNWGNIKMNRSKYFNKIIFVAFLLLNVNLVGQSGVDRIISDTQLIEVLTPLNDDIIKIKNDFNNGKEENALKNLAQYFSNKMSDRYFFDWKNFHTRFEEYKTANSGSLENHYKRADEHMSLFTSDPQWVIPSKGKDGSEISAYKLRHLARQHKALDIAYVYFLENENREYLDYLIGQVNSLADNYVSGDYDKKGNAIFESFRAGYRVYNWLFIYNSLLASDKFTWRNQIDYLKTFYYHAKELENESKKFRFGNHQTKGLVSLALISMLFPEFDCSKDNLKNSFNVLIEHLTKEIKPDGFQFERTVHYHIGDINNYFYVYQMAKLNNIDVPDEFYQRFHMMFDALVQLAMPNKKLPVLQDDTDAPWAEYNEMGSVMSIGAILFEDPKYKYFSNKKLSSSFFWFFRESDIQKFNSLEKISPIYGSTTLPESGYYVMRNGWEKDSQYLIISAGLSDKKPDHQHGDMLGLYAYANENITLPNYQCRYFLSDYEYFKNSFVKNVALVDSIPQGQNWKGNTGGSGFGKWKSLPEPRVINWQDEVDYSLFIGSHDGYEDLNIDYSRMVLFIKDEFYIIKDHFNNRSETEHQFQQVWQGNYSAENENQLLRSTFPNGSGLDIYQMNSDDYAIAKNDARGKGSSIVSSRSDKKYSFLTLLSPFRNFDNRLIINENNKIENIGVWKYYKNNFKNDSIRITADKIISNGSRTIIFGISSLRINEVNISFPSKTDILLHTAERSIKILSLNSSPKDIKFSSEVELIAENKIEIVKEIVVEAGKTIKIIK